jgi:outer membrane protein assembly factor BamA
MSTVYELKQEQQELLDRIYWLDEDDTEADIIKRQLEQIEGSVERKLAYLTSVLAEAIAVSRVTTEARKEAQARLELKEKRAKRAEDKLRQFILQTMQDFSISKVEGDILNVSQYERDSLIMPDFVFWNKLAPEFKRQKLELDKKAINDFLKNGGELEGFSLEKKPCLRIS